MLGLRAAPTGTLAGSEQLGPGLNPAELADRPRVRAVLRVPGRRDQPVVPRTGLRQPLGRPAQAARGGLPLHRRHHQQSHRVHQGREGTRARETVLPVLRARCRPLPAPRPEGMDRAVRREVRRGLRSHPRADAGPAEADGDRPSRHRAAASQPRSARPRPGPGPRASHSRSWTSPSHGSRCPTIGESRIKTQPGKFMIGEEGLYVGRDSGEPVTDDYPGASPHRFTGGTIKRVAVDVSGDQRRLERSPPRRTG